MKKHDVKHRERERERGTGRGRRLETVKRVRNLFYETVVVLEKNVQIIRIVSEKRDEEVVIMIPWVMIVLSLFLIPSSSYISGIGMDASHFETDHFLPLSPIIILSLTGNKYLQ